MTAYTAYDMTDRRLTACGHVTAYYCTTVYTVLLSILTLTAVAVLACPTSDSATSGLLDVHDHDQYTQ